MDAEFSHNIQRQIADSFGSRLEMLGFGEKFLTSPKVDRRLSEDRDRSARLAPDEWQSGDILWIIDAVGHQDIEGDARFAVSLADAGDFVSSPIARLSLQASK